jgi:DNA-binding NarL/FixJ family response regulator
MSSVASQLVSKGQLTDQLRHPVETLDEEIGVDEDDHYADLTRPTKQEREIAEGILAGYSLAEIARSTGLSAATLRKRVQRMRECHVSPS